MLLTEHEGAVWSVAVMTERAYVFTASDDKTVRMWKAGKCERVFYGKYIVINVRTLAVHLSWYCDGTKIIRLYIYIYKYIYIYIYRRLSAILFYVHFLVKLSFWYRSIHNDVFCLPDNSISLVEVSIS